MCLSGHSASAAHEDLKITCNHQWCKSDALATSLVAVLYWDSSSWPQLYKRPWNLPAGWLAPPVHNQEPASLTPGCGVRLDAKHVVFGRVLGDSMLVVRKLENVATGAANKPKLPVMVSECGEL